MYKHIIIFVPAKRDNYYVAGLHLLASSEKSIQKKFKLNHLKSAMYLYLAILVVQKGSPLVLLSNLTLHYPL